MPKKTTPKSKLKKKSSVKEDKDPAYRETNVREEDDENEMDIDDEVDEVGMEDDDDDDDDRDSY